MEGCHNPVLAGPESTEKNWSGGRLGYHPLLYGTESSGEPDSEAGGEVWAHRGHKKGDSLFPMERAVMTRK